MLGKTRNHLVESAFCMGRRAQPWDLLSTQGMVVRNGAWRPPNLPGQHANCAFLPVDKRPPYLSRAPSESLNTARGMAYVLMIDGHSKLPPNVIPRQRIKWVPHIAPDLRHGSLHSLSTLHPALFLSCARRNARMSNDGPTQGSVAVLRHMTINALRTDTRVSLAIHLTRADRKRWYSVSATAALPQHDVDSSSYAPSKRFKK